MILRLLGVFSLVILLSGSCMKKFECNYDACAYAAPAAEIQALQDYITSQGIVATQHCSGVFYRIEAAGTGKSPDACSNIGFRYRGTLLSGALFDESTATVYFSLGNLITAWKNVVPLLKEGGKIVMYIPPSLGYGPQAQPNIPANSNLVFEMYLDVVY